MIIKNLCRFLVILLSIFSASFSGPAISQEKINTTSQPAIFKSEDGTIHMRKVAQCNEPQTYCYAVCQVYYNQAYGSCSAVNTQCRAIAEANYIRCMAACNVC